MRRPVRRKSNGAMVRGRQAGGGARNEERLNPAVRFSLSTKFVGYQLASTGKTQLVRACGSERAKLLSRSGFSGRGRSSFDSGRGGSATAASRTTAAAAAAARAAATTTATTATTAARRRAAARTAAAARTTTAAATAASAAAALTVTESRSFRTTDEGHANQREENRDTENNDTIHA